MLSLRFEHFCGLECSGWCTSTFNIMDHDGFHGELRNITGLKQALKYCLSWVLTRDKISEYVRWRIAYLCMLLSASSSSNLIPVLPHLTRFPYLFIWFDSHTCSYDPVPIPVHLTRFPCLFFWPNSHASSFDHIPILFVTGSSSPNIPVVKR